MCAQPKLRRMHISRAEQSVASAVAGLYVTTAAHQRPQAGQATSFAKSTAALCSFNGPQQLAKTVQKIFMFNNYRKKIFQSRFPSERFIIAV